MKANRILLILLFGAMNINLFAAGSIVIKNGSTDVSNGNYEMPIIDKVGDAPSQSTLNVELTNMASVSLYQDGDVEIDAVLSGSSLYLTFTPDLRAGKYNKSLVISGTDLDGNKLSASVDISAICRWGKPNFQNIPEYFYSDGTQMDAMLIVEQTSYYGFTKVVLNTYVGAIGGYKVDAFCRVIDEAAGLSYLVTDGNQFVLNYTVNNLPFSYGNLFIEIICTNSKGETFTSHQELVVGDGITKAHPKLVSGFDLSSCFDAAGNTVMDSLFLLSNTYCAVFSPDATGKKYEWSDSFNPSYERRILRNAGGKKLYFSGRCDNAYTGRKDKRNSDTLTISDGITDLKIPYYSFDGLFNLIGGITSTDIYIENLNVKTQPRSGGDIDNGLGFMYEVMPGASNVFAIISRAQGTGSYYKANFHVKGDNRLVSNEGGTFYLNFLDLARVESDGFVVGSAPIAVRGAVYLDSENVPQYFNAQLNFDDYWIDGTATNGFLDLWNNGQTNVGSIDLGNQFGQCNFYGGRYKLASGATRRSSTVHLNPKPQFARYEMFLDYFMSNSLAINYRVFEIGLTVVAMNITVPIAMYGFGNDMVADGQVKIYGGTFETYGVSDDYMNDEWDYCYYRDKHDLRIPKNSQVNGGSFNNCDVYLCDTVSSMGVNPINMLGDTVCKLTLPQTSNNPDGSAIFEIPAKFRYVISGTPMSYNDNYGLDGVVNKTPKHGVTADGGGNVHIYVPCEMDDDLEPAPVVKNKIWWTNVFPQYSANATGLTRANSGDSIYNSFFVDVNLDTLVYNLGHSFQSVYFNTYRGTLLNTENIDIQRRLYIVMPVETNRWYNFVAPFDISNVYEVNTTQYPTTLNASAWSAYKTRLRDNNYKLILGFAPQLIFGAHMDMLQLVQAVGDTLMLDKGLPFSIDKLTPYYGNNADAAHFYLYYPKDTELNQTEVWKTADDGAFSYDWEYVTPIPKHFEDENGENGIDADVIMEAKHVYGFSFPGSQRYPYWNNRYLIFEGYGKQTIYGSAEQSNFVNSASSGTGKWGGNYTFCGYPIKPNMYVLDTKIGSPTIGSYISAAEAKEKGVEGLNYVDSVSTTFIESHNAYMIVNRPGGAIGQYTGMNNTDETTGQAPTIADVSFVAYQNNGLIIQTYQPQTIRIYDIQGKEVFSRTMATNEMAVTNLSSGVYVIVGATDNLKITIQ